MSERFLKTDCPHFYRYGEPGESEEDYASRLAGNLEELIVREGRRRSPPSSPSR